MVLRRPLLILLLVVIVAIAALSFKVAANQDIQDVGTRAHDLRKGPFGTVYVELDTEVQLDEAQVSRFTDFIQRYTGKVAVLNLQVVATGAPQQVTEEQAIAYARATRNSYSWPLLTLAIHVLVLNSELTSSPPPAQPCTILCPPAATVTAAETFDATEMIVYGRVVSNSIIAPIMSHEFGHMMGLCGISMPDPQGICDGSGHARDSQSLMAPVLNTGSTWVQSLTLMPAEVALLDEL